MVPGMVCLTPVAGRFNPAAVGSFVVLPPSLARKSTNRRQIGRPRKISAAMIHKRNSRLMTPPSPHRRRRLGVGQAAAQIYRNGAGPVGQAREPATGHDNISSATGLHAICRLLLRKGTLFMIAVGS